REGAMMGTPDFIAPEQALESRGVGPLSDVYSLGCTLYFFLAGQPPFPGGTLAHKLLCHQQVEPAPLDQLVPGLPGELAVLVREMVPKRPEDRPPGAGAVAAVLANLPHGAPLPILPALPAAALALVPTVVGPFPAQGGAPKLAEVPARPWRRR